MSENMRVRPARGQRPMTSIKVPAMSAKALAAELEAARERRELRLEMAARDRADRCARHNNLEGEHMRYCEACEVGLGIMLLSSFRKLRKCKYCGGQVHSWH